MLNDNDVLQITYCDLKDMLNEFQNDGLSADGCTCGLHLDPEEEVHDGIKYGFITVIKKE